MLVLANTQFKSRFFLYLKGKTTQQVTAETRNAGGNFLGSNYHGVLCGRSILSVTSGCLRQYALSSDTLGKNVLTGKTHNSYGGCIKNDEDINDGEEENGDAKFWKIQILLSMKA